MRRSVFVFLLITGAIIIFLVYSAFTLLQLLVETGEADAIPKAALPAPGKEFTSDQKALIPNIIHQTYKTQDIPEEWKEPQEQCKTQHGDYEFKFWTDEGSRKFIEDQFPQFLDLYDSYPYDIQRADVIRYFVLFKFGGTYVDLDDGCNRRLDPLNIYPAWVHRTDPTGISNDVMGSRPNHPFWEYVLENLERYNRNWLLPYVTVMYSTGPLFLSVMWKQWIASGRNAGDGRIRILKQAEFNKHAWSFFNSFAGSSWHAGDAVLFLWVQENWLMTVSWILIPGLVLVLAWWLWARIARQKKPEKKGKGLGWNLPWRRERREGYELVDRHPA